MAGNSWHFRNMDAACRARCKKEFRKLCVLAAILLAYLIWCRIFGFGIPCMFHLITRLDCPGCGMSRAGVALSHLQFREAYQYNHLSVTLMPLLAFALMIREIRYIRTGNRNPTNKQMQLWGNAFYFILLVWAIGYAVLRNLPVLTEWWNAIAAFLSGIPAVICG